MKEIQASFMREMVVMDVSDRLGTSQAQDVLS